MNKMVIEISVDDKGSPVIKQFGQNAEGAFKQTESAAKSQMGVVDQLKNHWVAGTAAIVSAWMTVNKAIQYMDEGAKALQVESSFKIMAESSNVNANMMIANMKRVTRETVDDSDLMQKAVKLMVMGYDPAQIERFSNVVVTASQITGQTVGETYETLADAIATKMPKALVKMGAVTREQIKIVNAAVAEGADEMSLYELAMANLELKTLQLRGTQDQATIALQQFHAEIEEGKETVGKYTIEGVQLLWVGLKKLGGAAYDVAAGFASIKAGTLENEAISAKAAFDAYFESATGSAKQKLLTDMVNTQYLADQKFLEAETMRSKARQMMGFDTDEETKQLTKATKAELDAANAKVAADLEKLRQIAAVDKAAKDLDQQWRETQRTLEAKIEQSGMDDLTKKLIQNQLESDRLREKFKSISGAFALIDKEQLAADADAIKTAQDKYEKDALALEKSITDAAKKTAEERAKSERDLYKDIRGYEGEYYDASIKLIQNQAKHYRDLGIDQVVVAKWIAEETKKAAYEKAAAENDFWAGVEAQRKKDEQNQTTWGKMGIETYKNIKEEQTKIINSGVTAFIKGEDTKVAVQKAAGDAIVNITSKFSTKSFDAAIDNTIKIIGAYIGKGAAGVGAEAASQTGGGGVWAAIGQIALYLGAGVGSMLGGKALANQFRAEGGWIGTHPDGGFIRQGSGVTDDVYLGRTGNTRHWGMRNEFVVNAESSAKHAALLQAINKGYINNIHDYGYADGGYIGRKGQQLVGDPDDLANRLAFGGEMVFGQAFGAAMTQQPLVEVGVGAGIVADLLYIGTAIGGAIAGKAMGDLFHSRGGEIIDVGHSLWGNIVDIIAPGVRQTIDVVSGKPSAFESFDWREGMQVIPGAPAGAMTWSNQFKVGEKYLSDEWKSFLDSQRAGWRNVAEVILTPGDMSMDAIDGLKHECEHFREWIKGEAGRSARLPWDMMNAENGLNYVPRDNFPINAHRGEAVLKEADAVEWRSGGNDLAELVAEIKALRAEIKAGNYVIARNTGKIARTTDRWDGDGMPAERVL